MCKQMCEEDYINGLMTLSNESFLALYENEDVIESSNLCDKCKNQVLDSDGKLDCPCWSSIVALGKDNNGEDIVVSCESYSK